MTDKLKEIFKIIPWRKAGLFILVNMLVFTLSLPVFVLFGPFVNVKNSVLGAIATSRHHSILNYIMSQDEINKLAATPSGASRISLKLPRFSLTHDKSIKLVEIDGGRFKGYLLEVADPTRIKVGTAAELGVKGETTGDIAKRLGAAAAINGGGFDDPQGQGTGAIPYGVVIQNGKYVAGASLTGRVNLVGFDGRGTLIVGEYSIKEMKNMGIREGVSFLPPLIINGKKQIQGDGGWGIAPRTAIGQRKDGTVLMLVIDGRQPPYSIGATLADVQNVLFENGAYTAGTLDGGSSTVMYLNNKLVNNPSNLLGISQERTVPTAFIVK